MKNQKKFHFIYKTTNLLSGRYYIGMHSANSLEDGYLGSGVYLRRSLNKYGKENHIREILELCESREELKSREEEIVNLQEIAKKECMNLMVGGRGRDAESWANDIRKPHSSETKQKISETLKGQKFTEERIQNISKGRRGIATFTGKKHSMESLKKMSLAQKGVPKPKVKCPHCEKIGGYPQMKQYHFEKCKNYK